MKKNRIKIRIKGVVTCNGKRAIEVIIGNLVERDEKERKKKMMETKKGRESEEGEEARRRKIQHSSRKGGENKGKKEKGRGRGKQRVSPAWEPVLREINIKGIEGNC